jgi:hypothetical protein
MKTVGNEVDKIRKIMGFILESKKIDRPYSEKSNVNYNKMKHSDDYVEHPDFNQKFDYIDEIDQIIEKWSEKYKMSIDCDNPKGFSQRAHCKGKSGKRKK